jgi:putative transcriptional regulator
MDRQISIEYSDLAVNAELTEVTKRIGGKFLIASPYLTDPNFFRSVIYVVRHDAEGAFGLVINRPSGQTLEDAFTDLLGRCPKRTDSIYVGGPVNGPLMGLHDCVGLGDPANGEAVGDDSDTEVWITADEDHLRALVDRPDIRARFIARYSGWGPSQLDHELDAGGWLVVPCDKSILFGDHESSWETAVKRLGRDIIATAVSQPLSIDPLRN